MKMKTVLALVDFSTVANNSVTFAAELCKRSSARLVIVNILQKTGGEEDTTGKLKAIEADLKQTFGTDLACESFLAHGELIPTVRKIIAAQQPDLIVMGTKGASGLKKLLIGSNTVKVIANTKIPVLVIPEVARFNDFLNKGRNRIILATDLLLLENADALSILKEMALLMPEPKVRVLSVRPKNTELSDLKRRERDFLLSLFYPEVDSERVTVFSSSVIGGINYYLSEKSTDTGLVAMIARDSGRALRKHFTRDMYSHTHLPLLVMHDNQD